MDIIKIVLVDDHPIFASGLSLLLNQIPEFKVVGQAENGQVFLDSLQDWDPDVALMDIKMPVLNGVEATKRALETKPDIKIIALTMFGESYYCSAMADAGAEGFVEKNISGENLERAIKQVMEGKNFFSRKLMENISNDTRQADQRFVEEYNEHLTEREQEVLGHIANGLSAQEIAKKMFISARTVEGHRASLISKTGTRNVVDLIIYAIRNGLIEL